MTQGPYFKMTIYMCSRCGGRFDEVRVADVHYALVHSRADRRRTDMRNAAKARAPRVYYTPEEERKFLIAHMDALYVQSQSLGENPERDVYLGGIGATWPAIRALIVGEAKPS